MNTRECSVLWKTGMQLLPQHFQQQETHIKHWTRAHDLAAHGDSPIGFVQLSINHALLGSGVFSLDHIEAWLPGGLYVQRSQCTSLSGEIPPHATEVYLEFPSAQTQQMAGEVVPLELADALAPDDIDTVDGTRLPVQIGFSPETAKGVTCMRIASLERLGDRAFRVLEDRSPEIVRLAAWPPLAKHVANFSAKLHETLHSLEALPSQGVLTRTAMVNMVLKQTLARAWVNMEAVRTTGTVAAVEHAFRVLHAELVALAGDTQVTLLRDGHSATRLPLHIAAIDALLERLTQTGVIRVPLHAHPDGTWQSRLPSSFMTCRRLFLAIDTNAPLPQGAERLIKVSTPTRLPSIVASSVAGATMQVCYPPPPELPARVGRVYLHVLPHADHWDAIAREHEVAVYIPSLARNEHTHMEFYGLCDV